MTFKSPPSHPPPTRFRPAPTMCALCSVQQSSALKENPNNCCNSLLNFWITLTH
jgi:hypothetical protein